MSEQVEKIGCPVCGPSLNGPRPGPGCEQCEGQGWVYKVPDGLGEIEVMRQIAALGGFTEKRP